jgi:ureidoglycolate lyase
MTPAVHPLRLERLTAEAFAPFGHLVARGEGQPTFATGTIASWPIPFAVDDALHLMWCWYPYVPLVFDRLERHAAVTQAFLPLGGAASVMVVAPGGAGRPPEPVELRAFLVPGDAGIVLARHCWHALTRFPAQPPGAAFALLTSKATQAELEAERAGGAIPTRTVVVDFAARGVEFRVEDPDRLLG